MRSVSKMDYEHKAGQYCQGFLVPMLCVGMHTGRLCLPFCESQSPYDPHTCMYPKIEAEPLRTRSQAEHGDEKNLQKKSP